MSAGGVPARPEGKGEGSGAYRGRGGTAKLNVQVDGVRAHEHGGDSSSELHAASGVLGRRR